MLKETNSFSRGMAAVNLNENATETSRFNVFFSDRYSLLTSRSEGPILFLPIIILPSLSQGLGKKLVTKPVIKSPLKKESECEEITSSCDKLASRNLGFVAVVFTLIFSCIY